jgi:hypothetical protein
MLPTTVDNQLPASSTPLAMQRHWENANQGVRLGLERSFRSGSANDENQPHPAPHAHRQPGYLRATSPETEGPTVGLAEVLLQDLRVEPGHSL